MRRGFKSGGRVVHGKVGSDGLVGTSSAVGHGWLRTAVTSSNVAWTKLVCSPGPLSDAKLNT